MMRIFAHMILSTFVLSGCTEPRRDGTPEKTSKADVREFEGLATQLVFIPLKSRGYDIYRPQSPRIFQVGIEYEPDAGTVAFPKQCVFSVEYVESTLAAKEAECRFLDDSGLPNEDIKSKVVNEFKYDLGTTRLVLSSTRETRLPEGGYGSTYEVLQGVVGDDDTLLKYPAGTNGFEFRDARLYTFQPKALDDESGCDELTQFRSEYADGIIVEEGSGEVLLSGWGCSTELRGTSEKPVACDYQVELPDAVPRLWLSQLELSETGFLMKGEFRGTDYKYCVELEAQSVTKL